jgi:glycosyltransferase involved in cell wall biosynthesis
VSSAAAAGYNTAEMPKVSVVIPVFNEEATIEKLLGRVVAAPLPEGVEREIVVVNDASTDGTSEKLEEIQATGNIEFRLFDHRVNQGKGAALRTAFSKVTGDIVLVQDADLEYHPNEYSRLLQPILDGEADVVYGSRFGGGPQRVLFFWHYVGNRMLTLLSNMFTDLNLSDMETCYKVFRREVLDSIELRSNRFAIEPEITAKIAKQKVRIFEIPISYYGRTYAEGKKIGWKDGFAAIWAIVRYNLFP